MKHFDVWLSLVGGTTFGLLFGYYLGHGLRDDTPDTGPVGASERDAVSFSTWRAGGDGDRELRSSIDNETRMAGGRIESLSESIDKALRLPTPADEVQLLMLLQSLGKEDFPIFLKVLRETQSTMSLHSSKVGGAVVWATFWQKFGAVDPQAAVVSAVSCQNLNYEGRHLLEKHLFSSIGQTDPTLAARLYLEHPELRNRERAAEGLILGWAEKDPAVALEWAQKNLDGESLNTGIYAATWAASNGLSESPDILHGLRVANSLPEGVARASALRSLKDMILQRSQVSTPEMLEFVTATRAAGSRDGVLEAQIAARCAALDPITAATFFTQPLPNETRQTYPGLRSLINQWVIRDVESAEAWIAQQEGTPHFEIAARELAMAKSRLNDPKEVERRLNEAALQKPR